MGKGIFHIHKNNQRNWPYLSPNTIFFVSQRSDASIQTQLASAYDNSVGAHDLASSGLDQMNNKHGNTDVNDNNDSHSFETPRKNNCCYYCFGDAITTITTPYSSTLPPPGK